MKYALLLLVALGNFALPSAAVASECVVLLHGLWRTERSMNAMEESLREHGFDVQNIEYDSTEASIAELAMDTIPRALSSCGNAPQIHFVTHSMGGILLRYYLQENEIPRLARSVMLGPPNQGSEVVDNYRDVPGFEWFSGPAGLELGTGAASIPRSLGPVSFDLGIIAGNQSINPILSLFLPGADDGKVSVAATHVEGASDHVEMDVTHVCMMRDEKVIKQVIHYLEQGEFMRDTQMP